MREGAPPAAAWHLSELYQSPPHTQMATSVAFTICVYVWGTPLKQTRSTVPRPIARAFQGVCVCGGGAWSATVLHHLPPSLASHPDAPQCVPEPSPPPQNCLPLLLQTDPPVQVNAKGGGMPLERLLCPHPPGIALGLMPLGDGRSRHPPQLCQGILWSGQYVILCI